MNENISEQDYLRKHLEQVEGKNINPEKTQTENKNIIDTTVSNLSYFTVDVKELPSGIFYPVGTTIQIRPAEVKEIQAYSMVDDNNFHDIVEKMNEMLSACVRVKYANGKVGSYLDLRDSDRFYLIFAIKELTFQNGTNLISTVECSCGAEVNIELVRKNFRFFKIDDKLKNYFDPTNGYFTFETTSGSTYNMCPPTIGLQKNFTDYIIETKQKDKKINMSFLKIVPFTLVNRTSITSAGIDAKLVEFTKMNGVDFQFLFSAVDLMNFGIEKIVKTCSCGLEVHSKMLFPDGASALFVVSNAFDKYIKK